MNAAFRKTLSVLLLLVATWFGAALAVAADGAFLAGPDGLRYKDLKSGQGIEAEPGMIATIHFIGWLDEQGVRGREIYNSRAEGQPVSFMIGTEGVMPAWNAGVIGMREGGSRMLLVPPGMAWGKRTIEGVVPANAAVMFRIELLQLSDPKGS